MGGLVALVLSFVLGAGSASASDEREVAKEYEIKAALLYRFAKSTTWPKDAFADKSSPFVFGVMGEDPFGKKLEETLKRRLIKGRKIRVRRPEKLEEVLGCHLLFVAPAAIKRLPKILKATREQPTLVAGDTPRFAHRGGAINLYEYKGVIRFEVNPKAAKRAGLILDEKLLQVARIIKTEDEER